MNRELFAGWIVTKKSSSLNTRYFGLFATKADAWSWVNSVDPYRELEWVVWAFESPESYRVV